jgi:hypothetical protein
LITYAALQQALVQRNMVAYFDEVKNRQRTAQLRIADAFLRREPATAARRADKNQHGRPP